MVTPRPRSPGGAARQQDVWTCHPFGDTEGVVEVEEQRTADPTNVEEAKIAVTTVLCIIIVESEYSSHRRLRHDADERIRRPIKQATGATIQFYLCLGRVPTCDNAFKTVV